MDANLTQYPHFKIPLEEWPQPPYNSLWFPSTLAKWAAERGFVTARSLEDPAKDLFLQDIVLLSRPTDRVQSNMVTYGLDVAKTLIQLEQKYAPRQQRPVDLGAIAKVYSHPPGTLGRAIQDFVKYHALVWELAEREGLTKSDAYFQKQYPDMGRMITVLWKSQKFRRPFDSLVFSVADDFKEYRFTAMEIG